MPNQHTGGAISLEDLHELLWVYSDGGILRMKQADIAADLLLSRQRITQLFQQLEDAGRLTRNARSNSYTIADPGESILAEGR